MAKSATKKKTDWSLLPEELLYIISENLEDCCFDVVHARSVCSSWRSAFPFPSSLLSPSHSLPSFAKSFLKTKEFCILKKFPLFLFRLQTPAAVSASNSGYLLGGIVRDESEDHMELPSPLQCSVKLKIQGSDGPTLANMLDFQIIPLGHQYRIIDWDPQLYIVTEYRGVAFLPVNKDGGGREFVVLLSYSDNLFALTSVEMKWMQLNNVPDAMCLNLVTFRGRFYATFHNAPDVFTIDPYLLVLTPLILSQPMQATKYLVPSGNDELFLVEKSFPVSYVDCSQSTCRVSRLDEEAIWEIVCCLLETLEMYLARPKSFLMVVV